MPILSSLALPARWQGRERFAVLIDDFGEGDAVARLWAEWSADPARSNRIDIVAIAGSPLQSGAFSQACARLGLSTPHAWPPSTPDLHTLSLADGRVNLFLACGERRAAWRELVGQVDAFLLVSSEIDAVALPKAMARLAAPEATVTTIGEPPPELRNALRARGFELLPSGQPFACYRPRFTPSRMPLHAAPGARAPGRALVIGAGLAGAATAAALARHGWRSTVLERGPAPALEGSGNPAGLFHGTVNPDDGPHARFNRVASFAAAEAVRHAVERHGVKGSADGLLRLEQAGTDPVRMQALLTRLGLGRDYVQALDPEQAAHRSGLPLQQPAWFYPMGGWVHPAGLARALLADAGALCELRLGTAVARIERRDGVWHALDESDAVVDQASVIVLANAQDALRLAGCAAWPVRPVRGQISTAAMPSHLQLPRLPVAGGGYIIPPLDGRLLFGATAQAGDMDPALREADHRYNLAQLQRLLAQPLELDVSALGGRTGWRCVSDDRLPLIGAVPEPNAVHAAAAEQARFVARQEGLYVFSGLGSRGITWGALGGQLVASMIAGAPAPVSASLIEAVDPARFAIRAARRVGAAGRPMS
ncbi:FAD-dependent 5-carboxymethylaminomethyl-2-thiouridine(34) oxidoreductase MnmC [Rhizobacter sp. LjRoot28]|uniref:FAD-dependent 5-carboxymethylaminomethyl-2-thiouridine(34) oxidoreductase MnmC n=1 Tax=Rhizobacter sp. LjRoot28 TaxID=3342309 RepID=UPI003ED137EC